MLTGHERPPNNGAGANRRGCPVGHAFRNSNPPSRLHAHPRPGGRHSLIVWPPPHSQVHPFSSCMQNTDAHDAQLFQNLAQQMEEATWGLKGQWYYPLQLDAGDEEKAWLHYESSQRTRIDGHIRHWIQTRRTACAVG